jgi:DNA-binding GntR family transcriptional regulator
MDPTPSHFGSSNRHHGILEAVERRDGAEARRPMIEHLQRAGERVTHRFERGAAGPPG